MKIDYKKFLTQTQPQQQLQEAATTPAENSNSNDVRNVNILNLASQINNLNAVLNNFISDESNSFRGRMGKIFQKDKTAEKIANGRESIDMFSQMILKDLTGSLSALYENGKIPTQEEINNALAEKVGYLNSANGFRNYLVELANSPHLSDEEKARIKKDVFEDKDIKFSNVKPEIAETLENIYNKKKGEITAITNNFFTGFVYNYNENLEDAKRAAEEKLQASVGRVNQSKANEESQGGFLDVIFAIISQFVGEDFANSIAELFPKKEAKQTPQTPTNPEQTGASPATTTPQTGQTEPQQPVVQATDNTPPIKAKELNLSSSQVNPLAFSADILSGLTGVTSAPADYSNLAYGSVAKGSNGRPV